MILKIIRSAVTESGAPVSYHVVTKIELSPDASALIPFVSSWPTEQAYLQNLEPVSRYAGRIPLQSLPTCSGLLQDIGTVLTTTDWLAGGSFLLESQTTLESAKTTKWSSIKLVREQKEFSGFTWDGSVFDSDPVSQSRIQGGVQLAQIALQSAQPFSIDWTLQDNTVRTLTATEMIQVGLTLANHIQAIHAISRNLRAQIDAATTVEQVEQITWPTP